MSKIELSLPDHGALRIPLCAQQVLSIAKPGGGTWNNMAIEGVLGQIWVTMAGDSRDHVISPGDRLDLRGRGPVVAQAISESELRIFSTLNIKQPDAAFKAMRSNQGAPRRADLPEESVQCWRTYFTRLSPYLSMERVF